ncbi:MAG: hypothetical protein SWY16_01640 [Cyanobacteriota bacterium]|nr:hypothetical protein [Cyanobacteriota bacterium]
MELIRDIARKAIAINYLSLEAEERLRELLQGKYDREDFNAFIKLQQAAIDRQVTQESRELRNTSVEG